MELKDTALPIHADARVRIRPRLFLEGGFYVELDPGSPSAPELDERRRRCRVDQTAGPVQLHQILATFDQDTLRRPAGRSSRSSTPALDNGGARGARPARSSRLRPGAARHRADRRGRARRPRRTTSSEGIAATSKITAGARRARGRAARPASPPQPRPRRALAVARRRSSASTIRELDGLDPRGAGARSTASTRRCRPSAASSRELRPSLRVAAAGPRRHRARRSTQLRGLAAARASCPRCSTRSARRSASCRPLENRLNTLFPLVTPVTDCLREQRRAGAQRRGPRRRAVHRPARLAGPRAGRRRRRRLRAELRRQRLQRRATSPAPASSRSPRASCPGLGQLVGTATEPISGSRPTLPRPGRAAAATGRTRRAPTRRCADLTQRTSGGGAAAGARSVARDERADGPALRRRCASSPRRVEELERR